MSTIVNKDTIYKAAEVPVESKEYITFGDIYINANSEFTPFTIAMIMNLKQLFELWRNEFIEFFDFINFNLPDYLLDHPEEDYI